MQTKPSSQPTEVISARVPETLSDRIAGVAAGLRMSVSECVQLMCGLGLDAWRAELQPGESCRLVHADGSTECRVRVSASDYTWRTRLERLLIAHGVEVEFAAKPAQEDPS
jgi:hypothetical protein